MARSFNYLDREDLGRKWIDMINNATEAGILARHFGWFLPLMKSLPFKLTTFLFPDATATLGIHQVRYLAIRKLRFLISMLSVPIPWKAMSFRASKFDIVGDIVAIFNITPTHRTFLNVGIEGFQDFSTQRFHGCQIPLW